MGAIFMIPGYIVFDLIPKIFGYKGLTDWYLAKYKTEADALIFLAYIPFSVLLFCLFVLPNIL